MISAAVFSFCFAIVVGVLILYTKRFHISFSAKGHSPGARQSSHRKPTPRIGGLVLIGFLFAGGLLQSGEAARLILLLCLSSLPVFLGGFGEDIGFDVSPKRRLILSFVSAAIAGVLLNVWLQETGIPPLDGLLSVTLFAILATLLVSGGICHAINLIDGLNGLALGFSLIVLVSMASLSVALGDEILLAICLILGGSLAGLLLFNFPLGKIFLGDAGAYATGHLLTWIALLFLARHPDVAPFSLLLIFFWPIADMIFSILRRLMWRKPLDQPDRMHFHQCVMRAIELVIIGRRRSLSNPMASVVIWGLAAIPAILGVLLHGSNSLAMLCWGFCFIVFVLSYVVGIRTSKSVRRSGNSSRAMRNPRSNSSVRSYTGRTLQADS